MGIEFIATQVNQYEEGINQARGLSEFNNCPAIYMTVQETSEKKTRSFLERLGVVVTAYAEEAGSVPPPEIGVSDELLQQYMNQPVKDTLKGTKYTEINDTNYQKEVLGSDTPVMVLFYGALDKGSWGLGALTRVLVEYFPNEIKVCAYKIDDKASMTKQEFEKLQKKYPLEKAPAILFYKKSDKGTIEKLGSSWDFNGGIVTLELLNVAIKEYQKYLPKLFS